MRPAESERQTLIVLWWDRDGSRAGAGGVLEVGPSQALLVTQAANQAETGPGRGVMGETGTHR